MRGLGSVAPDEEEDHFEEAPGSDGPQREVAQVWDFVEVAGGAGVVAAWLRKRRWSVLVLDLSRSKQFDLREPRVIEWLLHMVQH